MSFRSGACLALALAIQLVAFTGPASAETSRCPPYPCYHTAQGVLDWKPSMVRPYDVAGVPLADRAATSEPGMLVGLDNGNWSYWDESDLNAQGSDARGNVYNFANWPYVDRLYYYSHNLLSVPPTVWTDAAHRQGVKVLASLTGDCDELKCEKEFNQLFAGHPDETVDQLHRIAAAYGFDGWMIDIEQDASLTPNLLAAMSELSKRRLPSGRQVDVAFYNAFQYAIDPRIYKALKAAGHWQSDYSPELGAVGYPKQSYDFLKTHEHAGLADDAYWSTYVYKYETAPGHCDGGTTSAAFLWNGNKCLNRATLFDNQDSAIAPKDPPGRYQAPSLYAPAWTMFGGLSETTDTLPARGKFQRTESALWQGPGYVDRSGRCVPANRSANAVSSSVEAQPAIARIPFVTRFDTGEGSTFSAQGLEVRSHAWNLLSAQDPLPVAWCGQGDTLQAALDYGAAFDGGSSLRVSGRARDGSRRVYLYGARARLPAKPGLLLRYSADGEGVAPRVVVSLDGVKGPVGVRPQRIARHGEWVLARAELPGRLARATVTRVGLGFGHRGDPAAKVDVHIGELRIVDRDKLQRPEEIRPAHDRNDLSWAPAAGPTLYYNVWATDGTRPCLVFIGRTQIERYDLANPLFGPAPSGGRFEVQPVSTTGASGKLSGPRCRQQVAARGLDSRLDVALDRAARRAGTPGATAAIVEDGKVVWKGAYGRARAGHGGGMSPDSLVPIASTTKTVTATMAMALAQRGEVKLDRPIHHELPRLPASRRVTPRMLMSHASGLNDYFDDGVVGRIYRRHPFHHWTRGQVLAHVHRLKFKPGSRHSYSNTNYVALGGVLTHDSDLSVERLFRRDVAAPLGLRHSTFRYGAAPQRRFAHPLRVQRGGRLGDKFGAYGRVPTDYWGEVWTDGGLATTPSDLARIGNALYAGDLLEPASVKAMLPPHPGGWGLGTFDKHALGTRWIGHDGWYGGFQSENWTDRKRHVTIDVFTNRAGQRTVAAPIWRAIAAAYRR